jgi:NADH-ubiquinone/plastoquinone oxidoreductase chain 6
MGNVLVWMIWFLAAGGCLASGIAVVSVTNPFYSALALIGNLASLAVLYLLLAAEFLAAAQMLVYAGAVMVMFLFVVAYLGGRADAPQVGRRCRRSSAPNRDRRRPRARLGGRSARPGGRVRVVRQPRRDRKALPHRPAPRL